MDIETTNLTSLMCWLSFFLYVNFLLAFGEMRVPDLYLPCLVTEKIFSSVLIWKIPENVLNVFHKSHSLLDQSLWPRVFGTLINSIWVINFPPTPYGGKWQSLLPNKVLGRQKQ